MEEKDNFQLEELLQSAPGGFIKLALDDMLTILFATDKFYSLIKNVSSKAAHKAPQSLLRMVYSADVIYVTHQLASQKNRKDNMINFNFRTLQQDGSFKWVMVTGNRIQENHQSGTKQAPVYACMAMNITEYMVQYKKFEQNVDYNRTITELSKDLFFEYEIANDTLIFSEVFREVFDKEAMMVGFKKRLEKTKIIHPDELPAVVGIYNSMMSGRKQARFELRLRLKDGKYSWYICYASIIFDENRNPYKVVGKLSTMNQVENVIKESVYNPKLDTLTSVCTKESFEIITGEVSKKQALDSISAFMLIDIRNHKNVNEIRKSINGENLLTSAGRILKNHFRTSDIIGRIGMSEFAVYVKDISSDSMVYDMAEKLCEELEALYSYVHTKNGLIISIGITLQRGEEEYQTMLANANTALVMAKKVPTSSFEVFGGTISN